MLAAIATSGNFSKCFQITSRVWVGLGGLATDMQTLAQKLKFRANIYQLREEREIEPEAFGYMLSSMLYEKRYGTPPESVG
jgi:20S proteasome subunit beta 3